MVFPYTCTLEYLSGSRFEDETIVVAEDKATVVAENETIVVFVDEAIVVVEDEAMVVVEDKQSRGDANTIVLR